MNNKKLNLYNLIVALFCITDSFAIYSLIEFPGYKNQFILPLLYLVFFCFILQKKWKKKNFRNNILIVVIKLLCFIKYVICPMSYIYITKYGGWSGSNRFGFGPEPTVSNINKAIFLQCIELILISICLFIYLILKKEKHYNHNLPFIKNQTILISFLILAAPLVFLIQTESGIINVIAKFYMIVLLLLWTKFISKLHIEKNLKILLSLLGLGIYMIRFYDSLSRWNVIFVSLAYILVLKELYIKLPFKFLLLVIIIGTILFIQISFEKFSWLFETDGKSISSLIGYYISQIPDYFSGIRPLAQSLCLNEIYPITETTFVNDILGNVPGFGEIVNNMDRMNIYFNLYNWSYYREVLIIPLLGEGYNFIGWFAPIYSLVFIILALIYDSSLRKVKNIETYFILIYSALFSYMFLGFDLQILMTHLFTITIPGILLFYINSKIVVKWKSR